MTRRKSGPRSPSGFRAKGNLGEATIKRHFESLGHTVLNGQMAESAVDLILLCCQTLVEVKTQAWNDLPSPKRRLCALAGDLWRARGFSHLVVHSALSANRRCIEAGIRNNRASLLYSRSDILLYECPNPRRTGGNEAPVPTKEASR